ncbi:MAG: type II secretion system protein [Pseudomonadota bacterium]
MCTCRTDPPERRTVLALRDIRRTHGFTLIELAIVLFVVTLLLGGILTPLGEQIQERRVSQTRLNLAQAQTALVGYALARQGLGMGHLPCPDAQTAMDHGVPNDGLEDRLPEGNCLVNSGNLPWMTLGLADGDAWGNRLGYAVAPAWSQVDAGNRAAPGLEICADLRCPSPLPAAALLMSHGPNGFGASSGHGGHNLPSSAAEELENTDGDGRFIQHPPRAADRPGGAFDDILLPVSADWLRGRLCDPAGLCRAPSPQGVVPGQAPG